MDTQREKTDGDRLPQRDRSGRDEIDRDLGRDPLAGQNVGSDSSERERGLPTAYDVKDVHRSLREYPDDDLKQIPILEEGTPLRQGATYLDLEARTEFTARGGMRAEGGRHVVSKDEVPYPLWNRLRGVEDPERL
jgi:hypothetical protein